MILNNLARYYSWEQLLTMLPVYGVRKGSQLTLADLMNPGVKYGKFGRHIWDVNVLQAASRDLLVVS